MFEGITFQFPKLVFVFFFFLACEALCPLRANPVYFPRTALFGAVGVKSPLWLWIAKWAMIIFLVIALMSPVREREIPPESGYDILLVIDPAIAGPLLGEQAKAFVERRPMDRIALWVPGTSEVIIPLTREHEVVKSVLSDLSADQSEVQVTRQISRFFTTSHEGRGWALILSDKPKSFVYSLPVGVQTSLIDVKEGEQWVDKSDRAHPPFTVRSAYRYFDYYYVYPLFLGFAAMLAYLYGRNQKGIG